MKNNRWLFSLLIFVLINAWAQSSSVKENKTHLTLKSTQTSTLRQLWLTHLTGGSKSDMIVPKRSEDLFSTSSANCIQTDQEKNQRGNQPSDWDRVFSVLISHYQNIQSIYYFRSHWIYIINYCVLSNFGEILNF